MTFRLFSRRAIQPIDAPPQYDTLNDDSVLYQQLALEKNKVILDKIKMENEMINDEIELYKQIRLAKQQQLNNEINEITLISKKHQEAKQILLNKQKKENAKIITMIENENTQFIDKMKQLKEKQLELFQNTEWIKKNIEEKIPILIKPGVLSQSKINELYKSTIEYVKPYISWNNLSQVSINLWNMRAISYMKYYGESIDGQTLYSRCQKSGYSADLHTDPIKLQDGTILPCNCIKCIWARMTLNDID